MLNATADAEIAGRSWVSHALGIVTGAAVGLSLSKNYGGTKKGVNSFVGIVVFNEIMILTQPTRAITERDIYRRNYAEEKR
jgi:hypothetical protein